jgi:transposase
MKLEGFGVELSSTEWAEMLGVSVGTIHYWVEKEGKTIQDIYAMLGRKYNPPKTRKPRESAKMVETKERMAILLEVSGVSEREEALKALTIERIGTHSYHGVHYQGALVGVYDYRKGTFQLCTGQGIPLWKLEWEDAKVVIGSDGLWHVHPDTHRLLVQQAIKPDKNADRMVETYSEVLQAEKERTEAQKTYEGFGKRLNCKQWSNMLGVAHSTLWRALQRGESIEDFAERHEIKVSRSPKI